MGMRVLHINSILLITIPLTLSQFISALPTNDTSTGASDFQPDYDNYHLECNKDPSAVTGNLDLCLLATNRLDKLYPRPDPYILYHHSMKPAQIPGPNDQKILVPFTFPSPQDPDPGSGDPGSKTCLLTPDFEVHDSEEPDYVSIVTFYFYRHDALYLVQYCESRGFHAGGRITRTEGTTAYVMLVEFENYAGKDTGDGTRADLGTRVANVTMR